MNLKITNVETITVDVPFKKRPGYQMARQLAGWSVFEICKVETDSGIVGYGETMVNYRWWRVGDDQIQRVLRKNPFDFLWDDSLGAGLQMAIYDAAGKALEVPCYRLLREAMNVQSHGRRLICPHPSNSLPDLNPSGMRLYR